MRLFFSRPKLLCIYKCIHKINSGPSQKFPCILDPKRVLFFHMFCWQNLQTDGHVQTNTISDSSTPFGQCKNGNGGEEN